MNDRLKNLGLHRLMPCTPHATGGPRNPCLQPLDGPSRRTRGTGPEIPWGSRIRVLALGPILAQPVTARPAGQERSELLKDLGVQVRMIWKQQEGQKHENAHPECYVDEPKPTVCSRLASSILAPCGGVLKDVRDVLGFELPNDRMAGGLSGHARNQALHSADDSPRALAPAAASLLALGHQFVHLQIFAHFKCLSTLAAISSRAVAK